VSFIKHSSKNVVQTPNYKQLMVWILAVLFGLFIVLEVLLVHHFEAHVIKDAENDFPTFLATTLGVGILLLGLVSGFIYLLLRQTDTQTQAQQNLIMESEKRVKELAKQSRTIFWELNEQGIFTYMSEDEDSLTGYSADEVVGKMYFHQFYNKEKDQGFEERVRHIFEAKDPVVNQEDKLLCKDGSALWVLINAIPIFNEKGVFCGYRGILTDITMRKKAEEARKEAMERLQKIASRIPGVIYQYRLNKDGSSCFPFASAAIYAIYRVTPEEVRYDAQKVLDILHPDDVEGIVDSIQKSAQALSPWRHEYRVKFDDGEVRWLFGNALPQQEEDGSILWHGFIDDITDRKMMEQELVALNEMLDKRVDEEISARMKIEKEQEIERQFLVQKSKLSSMGEMMGAIAHQWRQPLNALNLNIQNLEDDFDEGLIDRAFVKGFIAKNTQTILFMSKTIDDFRNFFKIDKAKQLFSVKEALLETLALQSAQFKNRHIEVRIHGDDLEIHGFKGEFQQVILNILNNAKDALVETKSDGGHISITLEPTFLSIEDDAGGIDEAILERIFEPYFTTKDQGEGTGIGLYMSKMIIEKNMGGHLRVENGTRGAKFTIFY
jgi:PAS domain S-box-containing protein